MHSLPGMMTTDKKKGVISVLILFFLFGIAMSVSRAETGVMLADPKGQILFSQNPGKLFVPASTLKILTAQASIQTNGLDYRYRTSWYFDESTRNLFIKGYGDPLFVSEAIISFAGTIAKAIKGTSVHDIILDHTYFDSAIEIPGAGNSLNPYDATSGALCANFNTIAFQWDSIAGRYKSAEPQTPLLPFFKTTVVDSGLTEGRITLPKEQSRLYPGLLIRFFLEKQSVAVTGRVYHGINEKGYPQTFLSPYTLEDLLRKLLKYSNNFMANQLILTLGAQRFGPPATLEKGVSVLKDYAEAQIGIQGAIFSEGSGISRENRISPGHMIQLLEEFKPYHFLLTHGKDEFYKTGTLSGIRTRAGYIIGKKSDLYPFVIMINDDDNDIADIKKKLVQKVTQAEQNE